jgi:hypothetical protein
VSNGQSQTNGLGTAGFVISLISFLCLGGLISPISLIMCGVAMRKEPKGLAIAGLILSIVGSLWLIIAVVFIGLGAIMAALGLGVIAVQMEEAQDEMGEIAQAIRAVETAQGAPPTSLGALSLGADLLEDPWGEPYNYEVSGGQWRLYSSGLDGTAGTSDDIEHERR